MVRAKCLGNEIIKSWE